MTGPAPAPAPARAPTLRRLLGVVEPYVLLLLATVALATLLPPRGIAATGFDALADTAIVALFFLHGARLSREAIWAGASNWRLHAATLLVTFALFPLLGLGIAASGLAPPAAATGLLFLTLLPSTVQSSIAFTAIARGNVAAAVCSASFSNLLGIAITPALVSLLMHATTGDAGGSWAGGSGAGGSGAGGSGAGGSWAGVRAIVLHLLVPFVAGHLARPLVGGWVARQKRLVMLVDRGSILLVVYAAFGAAVVEGLWSRVGVGDLVVLIGWCAGLLALVLAATAALARWLGLPREDAVVLQFCGSKKSLASGVPMAGVLFPAAQVGLVLLPVMMFHQLQLIACAFLARRHAAGVEDRA